MRWAFIILWVLVLTTPFNPVVRVPSLSIPWYLLISVFAGILLWRWTEERV